MSDFSRPRFLVAGAGALGTAFGAMLRRAGCEVTFLGRNEAHMAAVRAGGVKVSGLWGEHLITGIAAHTDAAQTTEADYVLVTTKSIDTADIVAAVAPRQPSARFVTLQNGLGNIEAIEGAVGRERTIGGMVIIGFTIPSPGEVKVTVIGGDVLIGRPDGATDPATRALAETFDAAGITTHLTDNIRGAVWGKVLYNCSLNPLGAILDVPYGELASPHTWAIIEDVVKECFAVAASVGVTLKWNEPAAYLELLRSRQLPDTAAHRASMLQDIERGRRTEIDHLNGAIARLARERGIAAPVNESLAALVRYLEIHGKGDGR